MIFCRSLEKLAIYQNLPKYLSNEKIKIQISFHSSAYRLIEVISWSDQALHIWTSSM